MSRVGLSFVTCMHVIHVGEATIALAAVLVHWHDLQRSTIKLGMRPVFIHYFHSILLYELHRQDHRNQPAMLPMMFVVSLLIDAASKARRALDELSSGRL
jgi:hypothetical protein